MSRRKAPSQAGQQYTVGFELVLAGGSTIHAVIKGSTLSVVDRRMRMKKLFEYPVWHIRIPDAGSMLINSANIASLTMMATMGEAQQNAWAVDLKVD